MGYMHIENLYKNPEIFLFKECYTMEKIHGSSAYVRWKDMQVTFHHPAAPKKDFMENFDVKDLEKKFIELGHERVTVYGETYGGNIQKMRETYGDKIKFVAFEVKIGNTVQPENPKEESCFKENWLSVPQAEDVANKLSLEFVHYRKIPATPETIQAEVDTESIQAIRNGCGEGKIREGVVIRSLIELHKNNGKRIIAKHKTDKYIETKKKREMVPERLEVLNKASEIAEEWVTPMRLIHVLDKLPQNIGMKDTKTVIDAMTEDIYREAKGEIVESREVMPAIARKTVEMFKEHLKKDMMETWKNGIFQ